MLDRADLPRGGLHEAAGLGDTARVARLLESGTAVDQLDDDGRTALGWALFLDQRETALELMKRGANVNAVMSNQETPLMAAAWSGRAELVEALKRAGARHDRRNHEQSSALMYAAFYGRAEAVEKLAVAAPQSLELTDSRGMTALHHAAKGVDCPASATMLLSRGAAVDARDKYGATPLLRALQAGHVETANVLMSRGAQLMARDHDGYGALDYAVWPFISEQSGDHRARDYTAAKRSFDWLVTRRPDMALKADPTKLPILFRTELEALAARNLRPPLPTATGQSSASTHDSSSNGAAPPQSAKAEYASKRVMPRTSLSPVAPTTLYNDVLVINRGWSRSPNVVRRIVIRGLSTRARQQVLFSSRKDGQGDWSLKGALLIEGMSGKRRKEISFIGDVDDIRAEERSVRRLGGRASVFASSEIDFAEVLSTDRGSDRVTVTAIDLGRGFAVSELFLVVRGPGAESTLAKVEIEQFIAGNSP